MPDNPHAVRLEQVHRILDDHCILADVCWSVARGQVAAILGPNGSGKTSLLRMIAGYLYPTTGKVEILGHSLGQVDLDTLRRRMGIVDPASPWLPDDHRQAIRDLVVAGRFGHWTLDWDQPRPDDWERAEFLLGTVGLQPAAKRAFSTLSAGEKRRVLLARALMVEPELLLLDEPTAGLDLLAREEWLATLERLHGGHPDLTILLVTHHLEELPIATDNVLLMSRGRVAASGPPPDVLRSEILSEVFGLAVDVDHVAGRWTWSIRQATPWPMKAGTDNGIGEM